AQDVVGAHYLVTFQEIPAGTPLRSLQRKLVPRATRKEQRDEAIRLREELARAKNHFHAIVEDLEVSNQQLKSANEEVLSSNEELRSMNEELQTSKEEMQSANEELTTLNDELQSRNTELLRTASDLTNLLASTNLPILILSADLRIRHFTPT